MLKLPSKDELTELKDIKQPLCVTIYFHHTPRNTSRNPDKIRLKNHIQEARNILKKRGVSKKETDAILAPAHKLLAGKEFRSSIESGRALFLTPDRSYFYRLPNDMTPSKVVADKTFYTEPLEAVLADNDSFVLLSLDHKNVRVYEGDKYDLKEVELTNFPRSMEKALNIDEYPQILESHQERPVRGDRTSRSYHGQYNPRNVDKQLLLKFFRKVDAQVRAFLRKRNSPTLILSGVEYLIPIYKRASSYSNLLEASIDKNTSHTDKKKVQKMAWGLLGKA